MPHIYIYVIWMARSEYGSRERGSSLQWHGLPTNDYWEQWSGHPIPAAALHRAPSQRTASMGPPANAALDRQREVYKNNNVISKLTKVRKTPATQNC